jgi:glycosyltransferase involved in cell wall biosynthesis
VLDTTWATTEPRDTERESAALSNTRLIYVAPAIGHGGVGDYAADFLAALKPHFKEVTEFWVDAGPGESARDVIRNVRRIRALAHAHLQDGPTIVHFEQSGASLTPFWGMMLPREIPVTATIHDPPHPVWWPFTTRTVLRHRLLHHAVHYPLRSVSNALQRKASDGRILIALTSIGAQQSRLHLPNADVRATRHFIPPRPTVAPLTARPLAVGLFGYLYKAKGFDKIKQLRAHLDDDVEIVVAGRGTEALPDEPGVTVLGEVTGPEEDRFFERIRCLIVPYSKGNPYGRVYAASGAIARSYSYGTPVMCNLDGALPEIASEGGAIGVDGDIAEFARRANTVVRDEEMLRKLADEVAVLQAERTAAKCAIPFLDAWAQIAVGRTP